MSTTTFAPNTTGKSLWEGPGTAVWRNKDDACDDFIAATYQHHSIEWSATEATEWSSFNQFIGQLGQFGMGSVKGTNKTGGTLALATPVGFGGFDSGTGLPKLVAADPAAGIPAMGILLAAILNNASGYAYIGTITGTISSGLDQSVPTVGSPIYVAAGGGLTTTLPAGNLFSQIVGYTIDQLNPGNFYGVVEPPVYSVSAMSGGFAVFPECDLKTPATFTLPIPVGFSGINIDAVGLRLSTLGGTFTGAPTVEWGITGTNAKYLAATTMPASFNAVGRRYVNRVLLADDKETSLTFTITVGATGSSTIKGIPYFQGLIL